METVAAIDCDLRKIYCVHQDLGPVVNRGHPSDILRMYADHTPDVVLFEIASAQLYRDGGGAARNMIRWALYNVATATRLHAAGVPLLVAPSHVWTRGYDLKTRHKLAKASARNKDLRECEAMIWFYRKTPTSWVPFPDFLDNL